MDPAVEVIIQFILLFFVIFDPFASLAVFVVATQKMGKAERNRTATLAVTVAASVSLLVLLLGQKLLVLFSTSMEDFRVAGGIILALLGIRMAWGQSLADTSSIRNSSGRAIAAIIGTPLLTGPAAITSIMIAVNDYGRLFPAIAIAIVLLISALMFSRATRIQRALGNTTLQVISTFLGLITIAWAVKFIRIGLGI